MFKRLFSIFFIFALLTLIGVGNIIAATSEVSKMRIKKIAEIIRRYTTANEKLTDPYVKSAILDDVDKKFTLEPEEKANERTVKEIAKEVRKKVLQRFPDSIKTITKNATAKAENKFKLAEKLEHVTVRVQRGKTSYIVSGIFYGYGIGGKSVRIGDNTPIAFFDLTQQSRAMFDKPFCEREKRTYIDEKIRNYYRKKGSYTNRLFKEIRGKIASENESLGYIFAWDKWRTPKNVASYLIEKMAEDVVIVAKNDDKPTGDNAEGKEDDKKPDKEPVEVNKTDAANKLYLAKLKRSVEERQLEIAGSQYGIDADQGFNQKGDRILWGMKQKDANLIFNIPSGSVTDIETLTYQKGAYQDVKLHFINGVFFKVTITYRIGSMEAMGMLWRNINEKYGEAEESKKMREDENARLARLKAIKKPCPPHPKNPKKETHKWDKKSGKCKKCGIIKKDLHPPPPPLDQTYTWTGGVTKGVLKLRLNNNGVFTQFFLSKEDTNIQATQQALIDAERKRKHEEDKQKTLEEYRKSLQ